MQSKKTKMAYLNRMLKRLENERERIRVLTLKGTISLDEGRIPSEQCDRIRKETLFQLAELRGDVRSQPE